MSEQQPERIERFAKQALSRSAEPLRPEEVEELAHAVLSRRCKERPKVLAHDDDARDVAAYRAINTPEIGDFIEAIRREALHQRERWGTKHGAGKTDADWFWLIGYLAGKTLHAKTRDKQLHHIITTAAACLNWHAAKVGAHTAMRPGIDPSTDGVWSSHG
jgi:hypothetical protein